MVVTPEAIWQAAEALETAGVRPTLTAVRNKIGGGSFTTITNAMGQWRGHCKKVTAVYARPEQMRTRLRPRAETVLS
jgi:predicted methyltransferase